MSRAGTLLSLFTKIEINLNFKNNFKKHYRSINKASDNAKYPLARNDIKRNNGLNKVLFLSMY